MPPNLGTFHLKLLVSLFSGSSALCGGVAVSTVAATGFSHFFVMLLAAAKSVAIAIEIAAAAIL